MCRSREFLKGVTVCISDEVQRLVNVFRLEKEENTCQGELLVQGGEP
jgi:hypothetical protein